MRQTPFAPIAFLTIVVALSSPVSSAGQQTPSPKQVVEKFIDASGGQLQLESIESLTIHFHVEDVEENFGWKKCTHRWIPDKWSTHYDDRIVLGGIGNQVWDRVRNKWSYHSGAWTKETELTHPVNAAKWLRDIDAVDNVEQEIVNGRKTWRLVFWHAGNHQVTRNFDTETGLLIRSRISVSDRRATHSYGDFQKVDGTLIPFRTRVVVTDDEKEHSIATKYTLVLDSVETNEPISTEKFPPFGATVQLGDYVIEGVVTDSTSGLPIEGVAICVVDHGRVAFTNHEGVYRVSLPNLSGPALENLVLSFRSPVFRPYMPKAMFPIDQDQEKDGLQNNISLTPGQLVDGQVVNSETGQGVQATIFRSVTDYPPSFLDFFSEDEFPIGEPFRTGEKTDESGRFKTVVAEGVNHFEIRPSMPGRFLTKDEKIEFVEFQIDSTRIDDSNVVKAALTPLSETHIQVIDSMGKPARNFVVLGQVHLSGTYAYDRQRRPIHQSPVTIYGLQRFQPRILVFNDPATETAAIHIIENSETTALKNLESNPIELKPCATVTGTFQQNDDLKPGYVRLMVKLGHNYSHCISLSYKNDLLADEQFEFKNVPPECGLALEFCATKADGRDVYRRVDIGAIESGKHLNLGEIDLVDLFSIEGRITDKQSGAPIKDASLALNSASFDRAIKTDANGNYHLFLDEGLLFAPRAACAIVTNRSGIHLDAARVFDCGKDGIGPAIENFELTKGFQLTGRIVDDNTGTPVRAVLDRPRNEWDWKSIPFPSRPEIQANYTGRIRAALDGSFFINVDKKQGVLESSVPFDSKSDSQAIYWSKLVKFDVDKSSSIEIRLSQMDATRVDAVDSAGIPVNDLIIQGNRPLSRRRSVEEKEIPRYGNFNFNDVFKSTDTSKDHRPKPNGLSSFEIRGLNDNRPRQVVVVDREQALAATRLFNMRGSRTGLATFDPFVLHPMAEASFQTSHTNEISIRIAATLEDGFQILSHDRYEPPKQPQPFSLVPGLSYQIEFVSKDRVGEPLKQTVDLNDVQIGQKIDLGIIDFKSDPE